MHIVEYAKQQDPYLLLTGEYPHTGPCLIALSADAYSVAIAQGTDIWVYSANGKQEEEHFTDVHSRKSLHMSSDACQRPLVILGATCHFLYSCLVCFSFDLTVQ